MCPTFLQTKNLLVRFIISCYGFSALGVEVFDLVNTTEKEIVIYENSDHSLMANESIQFTADVEEFIERYK